MGAAFVLVAAFVIDAAFVLVAAFFMGTIFVLLSTLVFGSAFFLGLASILVLVFFSVATRFVLPPLRFQFQKTAKELIVQIRLQRRVDSLHFRLYLNNSPRDLKFL
jgi:hypothetical protein